MPINECCNLGVICCEPDASISDVALLMRKHHVGDVVVVENKDGARVPLGIVTDRDIVIETTALEVDVSMLTAGDIMSTPLVTVCEDAGFVDTLRLMRNYKVRRLPVVTQRGSLFGIVTADEIVSLLATELAMISTAIVDQPVMEGQLRR